MFLDTSFIVDLIRESKIETRGPALGKLQELGSTKLYLPIFVLCELRAGVESSKSPSEELKKLENITEFMQVVCPQSGFAVIYGETFSKLKKQGITIPLMDLLIGVLVKCEGYPLLTRDSRHFSLIPGLVIETY